MLITLPLTHYQIEKMKKFTLMKFSVEINDRKESEEGRMLFSKQKCALVPRTKLSEDGATVAATPTFPLAKQCGQSRHLSPGRTGSVLPWKDPKQWETPINYQKCPTNEMKQNAGDFQHLIDSPKKMN